MGRFLTCLAPYGWQVAELELNRDAGLSEWAVSHFPRDVGGWKEHEIGGTERLAPRLQPCHRPAVSLEQRP